MEQLSNIVMTTGLTGTASSSINSANVILKLMKLPAEIATNRYNAIIKSPEHSIFHNVRYSPFNEPFKLSANED